MRKNCSKSSALHTIQLLYANLTNKLQPLLTQNNINKNVSLIHYLYCSFNVFKSFWLFNFQQLLVLVYSYCSECEENGQMRCG